MGVWNPKVRAPKVAQINCIFCKVSFFPTMKSGSKGGGGVPPLLRWVSAVLIHP